jgi:hypothetical protein
MVSTTFTSSLVAQYLDARPTVAAALHAARARVVTVDLPFEVRDQPERFFSDVAQALDRAEAALAADDRPLFVAFTDLPTVVRTGAFELRHHTARASPFVVMQPRRGPFLGYVAIAEGGLAFFDGAGRMRGNSPSEEVVLKALRWPWP